VDAFCKEYIGRSDVTYLWSQYDRHFVRQRRRIMRRSGEDLSRYSND